MTTEKIISFATLVNENPSKLIWTTLSDVAELANTIIADTIGVEYRWDEIFTAFGGKDNLDPNDQTNALNAVRFNIGNSHEEMYVQSYRVASSLLGLSYIVDTSKYNLLDSSWLRIHSNILGAYRMNGIEL